MSQSTLSKDGLSTTIDSLGAQLMSLELDGAEYLWQGDERWWPRRAPVLFPIVGNLRNDTATSAAGPIKLGRHGLARNLDHKIKASGADFVSFELISDEKTREQFPYDFCLNMTYRLVDGALEQEFLVSNTGTKTLPFCLGGHPAFNVPAPAGEHGEFSEWHLRFAQPWTCSSPTLVEGGLWDFSQRMQVLDHSDTLPLTHQLFEVDTICLEGVPGRTVRLEGPGAHGVQLDFDGFDWLGIWSAANDAPFVAIEPWRGCATATDEDDVFEHKRGIDLLEPGEQGRYSFSIRPF